MLRIGEEAPDFTVPLGSGGHFNLHEHRGDNVALFFFPRTFTHG